MEFENRIKKAVTKGGVRELLDDASYRVAECSVEKTTRELTSRCCGGCLHV
jgi:hypothetical protein